MFFLLAKTQENSIKGFDYLTKELITPKFIEEIDCLEKNTINCAIAAIALRIIFTVNAGIATGIATAITAYVIYKICEVATIHDPVKEKESLSFFNSLIKDTYKSEPKLPSNEADKQAAKLIAEILKKSEYCPMIQISIKGIILKTSTEFRHAANSFLDVLDSSKEKKTKLEDIYYARQSAHKFVSALLVGYLALKILLPVVNSIVPLSFGQFASIYMTSKIIPSLYKNKKEPDIDPITKFHIYLGQMFKEEYSKRQAKTPA